MPDPVPLRFDQRHATRTIQNRARDSENVILTDHAQKRMALRGLSTRDVFDILRGGDVFEIPSRNEKEEWEAKIEKRMPGGRDAAVVTVIPAGELLIVKTVMWKDPR